ncbi:hypothetical protein C0991_003899 [Blastosporella zonata]|nr:hypothetical protein C0991_003899 [Blastosporella zonata]
MPRTGAIRRLPHDYSRQDSTSSPLHQLKPKISSNHKTSHRFVRIHHKMPTKTSMPSSTPKQGLTRVFTSHTPKPVDRKHKVLLAKNGHSAGAEVMTIPNPIPDTGFRSLPKPPPAVSVVLTSAPGQPMHSVPLSKTGLPLPLPTTPTENTLFQTASTPTFIPVKTQYVDSPVIGNAAEMHPTQATLQPHKLSIPIIVLLAVGCALLVIGLFSLAKYYSRPTRRPRPRPSLPVLDDPFADDKEFPLEDSPIFGGKESVSNSIWSWSHYPKPEIVVTKPPNIAQPARGNSNGYGSVASSPRLQGLISDHGPNWRSQSTYSGHGHTQSVPTVTSGNSPFQASLQQLQGALSRTATRMSAVSTSLYPSSPQHGNIGLAITRSPITTFTADGSDILKRSEPKAVLERSRSELVSEAARGLRNSELSSYSGSDIGSPSFLPYTAPLRATIAKPAGRSRIRSSYYNPNSYPRISNAAFTSASNAEGAGLGHQPSLRKSNSDRDRDTQALTQALGLSSLSGYAPPSPQPTLYPDDSLSVLDAKRPRKPRMPTHKKSEKSVEDDRRPSSPVIATAMDASAALGSLMLMDFTGHTTCVDNTSTKRMSRTGLTKAALGGGVTGTSSSGDSVSVPTKTTAPLKRSPSRSNDKPPSIPLPELLPSLEQMGLEHSNPQAYADYRSPTYSIYGLYGSDRKSGAGY